LIRRITSCPRVAAPVVRSRFCMRPGDCCAGVVFQWWGSIWRRKTKTGRTLCWTIVARVHVGSVQGGGRAWGGGGRRIRPEHTAENNAHPPFLSTDMFFWLPLCPPRGYSFVLFLFCENRATIANIVVAFRGTVWAYSRFRKNLARKLSHHSYKSAFTGSQRPICESGATVGVRGF